MKRNELIENMRAIGWNYDKDAPEEYNREDEICFRKDYLLIWFNNWDEVKGFYESEREKNV